MLIYFFKMDFNANIKNRRCLWRCKALVLRRGMQNYTVVESENETSR